MTLNEMAAVTGKDIPRLTQYKDNELMALYGWFLTSVQTTVTIMGFAFRSKRFRMLKKYEDELDNELMRLYAIRTEIGARKR